MEKQAFGTRGFRQRLRTGLMLVWLLLFPATLYYFSPYLPFQALAEGVVPGSLLLFALLFLTSLVSGRLFCGWLCPAGAVQHFAAQANPRRLPSVSLRLVKYIVVWFPWVGGLLALVIRRRGMYTLDILYQTEYGISIARPEAYIVYLAVLVVFGGLALAFGRRAACHSVCWMAPFMVFGGALGKALGLPRVRLRTNPDACRHCGTCDAVCPMSLEVERLAATGSLDHHDCILCGSCVDACPAGVLSFAFRRGRKSRSAGTAVLLVMLMVSACALDAQPLLVPPTVVDDLTLPRVRITVAGRTRSIRYRTFGDPANPALFVMPGSVSDIQPYLPFEVFADDYYVVLWDQRGQGLSERVDRDELSFDAMVAEIGAVKTLFSPNAPVTLLGHSWSAVFAALYAARHSQDTRRLILLEPFGFSSDIMKKADAGQVNLMTPGYLDMVWLSGLAPIDTHDNLDFRLRGINYSGVRPFFKDPDHLPPWPVRRVGGLALLTWEAALYDNGKWDFDLSAGFGGIAADVLLVGSEYSFIGYDFQKDWNAPLFGGANLRTLRLADSGHRMLTENWQDLSAGIRSFLEATP